MADKAEAVEDDSAKKPAGQRFPAKMKCDICGYKGSAQQVGGHIAREHGDFIKDKVRDVIKSSGEDGMTPKEIRAATGWSVNRVGRMVTKLSQEGAVSRKKTRIFLKSERPARKPRSDIGKKRGPRKNGVAVLAKANDWPSLDILPHIEDSRLVRKATQQAMAKLVEAHQDEYVKLFVQVLIETKVQTLDMGQLSRVAEVLVKA